MDRFMPEVKPKRTGLGNPTSNILILIDHPDTTGIKKGRVLASGPWMAFQQCLHNADLISSDVYIQALVPDDPRPKAWWKPPPSRRPAQDITKVIERTKKLLSESSANIILAMGDLSCYILTGSNNLAANRGYIFPCIIEGHEDKKVMPVQDVKQMVWGNYIWRYYLSSDLIKSNEQSSSSELTYDERYPTVLTDFNKVFQTLYTFNYMCSKEGRNLSMDIEVMNYQVSHIGFSYHKEYGYSIPFNNSVWTLDQETAIWKRIGEVLGNKNITVVGQNVIFDIHFLITQNNIYTKGPIKDTMMAQSIMFPDFLKGLGFLASTYLNVPSWKQMVSHKSIKEND